MIHVAYCFDQAYRQHLGAAITSLLCNALADEEELWVHVITDATDALFLQQIERLRRTFRAQIEVYLIGSASRSALDLMPRAKQMLQFSKAAYYRLLLPEILPSAIRRVLYLDSDTIVLGSIRELWSTAMGERPAAAVSDFAAEHWRRHLGTGTYVNSGVLLMNLDAWRSADWAHLCRRWAEQHPEKVLLGDQCAINAVLQSSILFLGQQWNYYVVHGRPADHRVDPAILHFITANKPWQAWYDNELGTHYWRYLDVSPWRGATPEAPRTIREALMLARLLHKQGKSREAVDIYEKILRSQPRSAK